MHGRDVIDRSQIGADLKHGSLTGAQLKNETMGMRDLKAATAETLGNPATITTTAQFTAR